MKIMAFTHSIPTIGIFMIIAALKLYTLPALAHNSFKNVDSSIKYNYRVADKSNPSFTIRNLPKDLDVSKPTINGFHLGTKDREIYKKLGKPTRKKILLVKMVTKTVDVKIMLFQSIIKA